MKRRTVFLIFSSAALLGLGLWGFWMEPASLDVAEYRLTLPDYTGPSLRVAVLTDLHIGSPFNGLAKLRATVSRTNAARADLVCILGDLVIQGVLGGRFVEPEAIAAELANLRARDGAIAVLGNHDGWFDHNRVRRALERAGIRVLEDTAARIVAPTASYWVAGISDLWTGRHDIPAALAAVPADARPLLLLTHNPDVFPEVPGRVELTLAGHTHGGQVRLPLIGAPVVPSRYGQRFVAGHIVEGGRHLFVATGVGTSILPVRFRVPPTIAVVTIRGS